MDTRRIRARDAAVRRLQRLTAVLVAAAGVLALTFSGLAAKAFPGRSSHATSRPVPHPTRARTTARPTQTPPPLVSVGSQQEPSAPSAPAAPAPAPTPAPPVVVSGGS